MIKTRKDYHEYLEKDRIALKRNKRGLFIQKIRNVFFPDYIWIFQKKLRKVEFYKNTQTTLLRKIIYYYLYFFYRKYQLKLGFTIPLNAFGPGLSIAHYGTIVVNGNAKIGSNCRIHTSVNIGASSGSFKAPQIGNNVYIGPGVKIFGDIWIADNVKIGANAVVNKSIEEEGITIAGVPAKKIK